MKSNKRGKGFTLVESMVVVVIIGILVAAAVPIYLGYQPRARATEAVVGLGATRSMEQIYFTEHDRYLAVAAGDINREPNATPSGLGLDFSMNTYFGGNCYSIVLDPTYGYLARCDGTTAANNTSRKDDINTIIVEMRGNGQFRHTYDSGTTWTNWE